MLNGIKRAVFQWAFREFSLSKWQSWLDGGQTSGAGVRIDDKSAMSWSVVYGCVLVKAQDIGKIPLKTYRRLSVDEELGREEAIGHHVSNLFRVAPNPYMSPSVFKMTMQRWLEVRGNAFARIERNTNGEVVALWPRAADKMRVDVEKGRPTYIWSGDEKEKRYRWDEILHLKGMSDDGVTGMSPLSIFADTIGLGLAHRQQQVKTFANGARFPYFIEMTPEIGQAKVDEFAAWYQKNYAGTENAGKTPMLYGGATIKSLGFSNRDAELIESQRLTNEDGYRIWRVAPSKVMDFLRATFSNITEVNIAHVTDTLMPQEVIWCDAIQQQLLREGQEREEIYCEFDNSALLKGTPKERAEIETQYVLHGISVRDEIRRSHNWKPLPDGLGKIPTVQQQVVPLGTPPARVSGEPAPPRSDASDTDVIDWEALSAVGKNGDTR